MKRKFVYMLCALLIFGAATAEIVPAASETPPDMLSVDHKLYELGYRDSACTGEMTDALKKALKNFQLVNGLEISGEADADTIALLMSGEAIGQVDYLNRFSMQYAQQDVLSNGAYGDDVRKLQQALKDYGYFDGECDGAYGRATEEAVYRFQLANGLKETGVADRTVFLRIYGGEPMLWQDFLQASCASAGESGVHVRRIQLALKHKNHFRGACSGRYGEGTQQAVKRFQTANGLEASGDVDMETCMLLYSDVGGMHNEAQAIRRGEQGNAVAELHLALSSLGFPSSENFNMQTELAVMQFQLVNELPITGVADTTTLARLAHPSVRGMDDFEDSKLAVQINDDVLQLAARSAASVLGQAGMFEDGFDFVSYVYLKCGQPLLSRDQLLVAPLGSAEEIRAGQIIFAATDAGDICGIATADGAVIYADESGFVVMRYMDMLQVETIYVCSAEVS